jgi:hypothetical protein
LKVLSITKTLVVVLCINDTYDKVDEYVNVVKVVPSAVTILTPLSHTILILPLRKFLISVIEFKLADVLLDIVKVTVPELWLNK